MITNPANDESTIDILKGINILLKYDSYGTLHTHGGMIIFIPVSQDRFLVKETKDHFSSDPNAMIIDVFVVLEIVNSKHGKIVIADYLCSNHPEDIEPYFLEELLDLGYKFSDDKKYENWTNGKIDLVRE